MMEARVVVTTESGTLSVTGTVNYFSSTTVSFSRMPPRGRPSAETLLW